MTQPTRETLDVEEALEKLRRVLWPKITGDSTAYWFKDILPILACLWATAYEEGVEWAKENYQPAMGTRE